MNFMTRELLTVQHQFFTHLGLELQLKKARPDLDVSRPDEGIHAVKVSLREHGGFTQHLVAARVLRGWDSCWHICATCSDGSEMHHRWPFDSPEDVIRDAVLAVYDAATEGVEVASPWRWGQPEDHEVVRLADGLAEVGLRVSGVLGTYAWAPGTSPGQLRHTPPQREVAVRVECGWGYLVLSRRRRLGWVLDAHPSARWRRLNLGQLISGTLISEPGVPEAPVSSLVAAAREAARQVPATVPDEDDWDTVLMSEPKLRRHRVARHLRTMCLEPDEGHDVLRLADSSTRILVTDDDLDLGRLQRAYAQALGRPG